MTIATTRPGFTLIELSLVLVIVALLIGGVLVGRDLIDAAGVRRTISQRDQIDASANAFRTKYNCLPGDCARASDYFAGAENGTGDGRVVVGGNYLWEHLLFWEHLAAAGLSEPAVSNAQENAIGLPVAIGYARHAAVWNVDSGDAAGTEFPLGAAHNYWITGSSDWCFEGAAQLLPASAYPIDAKIDDGLPMSGLVRAADDDTTCDMTGMNTFRAAAPRSNIGPGGTGNDVCVDSDSTPPTYNVANNARVVPNLCSLVLRANF